MTRLWLISTGTVMLIVMGVTVLLNSINEDPEGVTTRWWDGTREVVETFHNNGKTDTVTRYGDDGKTIVSQKQFDYHGALTYEKIRLADGKLDEKSYTDGKLSYHVIWLPDERMFVLQRMYNRKGNLVNETVVHEDGETILSQKTFYEDGAPKTDFHIDQKTGTNTESEFYKNGTAKSITTRHMNATGSIVQKYESGELFCEAVFDFTKGTGLEEWSFYEKGGRLIQENRMPGDDTYIVNVYHEGYLKFRQEFAITDRDGAEMTLRFTSATEFNKYGKLPTRKVLSSKDDDTTLEIQLFNDDGSMRLKKIQIGDSKVVAQYEYDEESNETKIEPITEEPDEISPELLKLQAKKPFEDREEEGK